MNMLDRSDTVSKVAFGRLFKEFDSKRMSRLAGDNLVDSENSVAIRSNWVSSMVDFVWKKRNSLMSSLTIVEQSLWKVVPHYLRRVINALRKHTGRPLPLTCTPMNFGSWMGGDRDGNPNVIAKVTRDVSLLYGWMIVDLYIREIDILRFELSMNQCSDSLLRLAHKILQKDNSLEDWEECWNLAVGHRNQLKHHGQQAASLPKQLPAGADLPYCTG